MTKKSNRENQNRGILHQIKKRAVILLFTCCLVPGLISSGWNGTSKVYAESQEPQELYAQSAVLMDADSGRILFAKNGQQERAMASTTKIMTCILALEYGKLDDKMTASKNAAAQPKVHLGVTEGEEFYLRDLLYSLMLESHNDAAVIIAENIGGSVEGFADMMNAKAKELGCIQTYFITPNGLDAEDENGIHHTTAEDLAKIMKYCIIESPQKEMFLEITRTPNYQFTDCSGTSSYSCTNHNAFLQMMEGALSGKTGFTGEAGYCYVGALKQGERTFIVALLACGWPNNKSYKWSDTKKLMNYGLENYQYKGVWQDVDTGTINVKNGIDKNNPFGLKTKTTTSVNGRDETWNMLLKENEQVEMKWTKKEELTAPVYVGDKVGEVNYILNGVSLRSYDIVVTQDVQEKTYKWCLNTIFELYTLKNINKDD